MQTKVYDHGHCKTVSVMAMSEKDYQKLYLDLCGKYDNVIQRVEQSFVNGLIYGYIKVYN